MENPAGQRNEFLGMDIIPITPSDILPLETPIRSIRAAVGGTLMITTALGNVRNTNILDGEILPICVKQVFATGTTATGIEGFI